MAINTPNTGEKILPWAREATREINANRPTAGKGITITKTNSGTTFSLQDNAVPHPDSSPTIVGGRLTGDGCATTYSLEKNVQNDFSLFGFSKIEPLSDAYHYSLDELSNHLDFVLRDTTSANTILSCPTVRYDNVLCLLVNAVSESDDDGDNPVRDALSVVPDSEIREPVTYSIQHNEKNEGELELYKFHDGSYQISSTIDVLLENNDEVLIRQRREDESGNLVRRLAYLDLKKVLSGDTGNLYRHFKVTYDTDYEATFINIETLDNAVLINGVFIPTDDLTLHTGENNLGDIANVYLNIYETNAGTPTDIANAFVWRIESHSGQGANTLRWSMQLAHVNKTTDPPKVETYRDGVVEVGALLPDSADVNPVGQGQHRTKSLEFTDGSNMGPNDQANKVSKSGLRLYGFAPQALNGGIGGNEDISEWFSGTLDGSKADGALALLYRDVDDGNGQTNLEQGTLKYLPLGDLNRLIITDTDVFRYHVGFSRSIQNVGDNLGQTSLGIGTRLYKFFEIQPLSPSGYTYSYPADVLTQVSAYSDIVVRKRHGSGHGVPEVGYIPLSSLPLSGGGDGWPLDGEEDDIGRSLNLNSNDEAQIYGFEDGTPVARNLNNRMFVMRRGTTIPRVEYLQLSTLVAAISADIPPPQGYTGDVKYVLSSTYSTSTHKFTNKIATMHFENGLLKWNDTTYLENQEVFTAVEEEL